MTPCYFCLKRVEHTVFWTVHYVQHYNWFDFAYGNVQYVTFDCSVAVKSVLYSIRVIKKRYGNSRRRKLTTTYGFSRRWANTAGRYCFSKISPYTSCITSYVRNILYLSNTLYLYKMARAMSINDDDPPVFRLSNIQHTNNRIYNVVFFLLPVWYVCIYVCGAG